ncbi:tripartite motif-containing protein 2-like [Pecten maximus]|uniref:tripartite motif-containing protein 2-like n=1 Tax=Pecten maximus TaxID=6579 RepID=UPI001458A79A|nr:tripartite motif-containing protein 2-like [Pecten maximus]
MATVSDPDDFTVCSICLQTFTSPKFLPCLHTFCEHCLQGWIEAQTYQQYSGVYNALRLTVIRVHRVHRAMKATRKHKLIGLEDVLRDLKCLSSNEMCNEHADEVIKLYCVDHDQPCCTICGAASHRKCDTVLELSEAAKDVSNTKRFRDLFDNLNQSEKDIGNAAKSLEENLSQLNREKLNIERSAKELKDALMNQIIALHNRFLKQLSDAYTCAAVEISADTEKCYLQQKVVKNSRQIFEKS